MKTSVIFGVLALGILANMPWNSARGQSELKLPLDYFKSLLRFRLDPLDAEHVLNYPIEINDEKNGYYSRRMDHGGMGYVFAVWNMKGGKMFAFSEPSSRDVDSYDTTFWTYQSHWVELKDAVPPLSLEDFWDAHRPVPAELRPYALFEMELPRTGTTIKVWLKGVCVKDECGNRDRVGREATYNRMELEWQYSRSRFVKGTKSLQR